MTRADFADVLAPGRQPMRKARALTALMTLIEQLVTSIKQVSQNPSTYKRKHVVNGVALRNLGAAGGAGGVEL